MARIEWGSLPRAEVGSLLRGGALPALALGALEQHGDHLPTGTDNVLASTVLDAAAERAGARVLVLPPFPFGFSPYHQDFGGTVSLGSQVLIGALSDVCRSVRLAGASAFLILNGHGGNEGPLRIVSHECSDRDFPVVATSYWEAVPREERAFFAADGGEIGHAGQVETSLYLALDGASVGPLPESSEPVRPAVRPPTIAQLGESGVIGDPLAADAGLGARFLDACIEELAALIDSLVEAPVRA